MSGRTIHLENLYPTGCLFQIQCLRALYCTSLDHEFQYESLLLLRDMFTLQQANSSARAIISEHSVNESRHCAVYVVERRRCSLNRCIFLRCTPFIHSVSSHSYKATNSSQPIRVQKSGLISLTHYLGHMKPKY